MRKGFTLVELSIVLVIVGLLIAGILAAQSMTETAKVQSQVRQFQQLDIIATQFKNKYAQLPGDSSLFTPSGNNNGNIEGCYTSSPSSVCNPGSGYGGQGAAGLFGPTEGGRFFKHLTDAGMSKDSYASADMVSSRGGNAVPKAKIGGNDVIVFGTGLVYGEGVQDGNTIGVATASYWYICKEPAAGGSGLFCNGYGRSHSAGLTPAQALAIDKKMDDGMPWSGIVLAGSQAGLAPTYPGYGYAADIYGCTEQDALAHPDTTYRTSIDKPECNLHVKMFSQAGDSE